MYLKLGYIPAPYTIYEGVKKLLPAHYLHIKKGGEVAVRQYWGLEDVEKDNSITADNLTERLTEKLSESASLRMIADVPVGMFLSGGIDFV